MTVQIATAFTGPSQPKIFGNNAGVSFNSRVSRAGESVATYLVALQVLA